VSNPHLPFEPAIDLLRALAEPTRCRLLVLLSHGELTVGEIAAVLGQSQPRISRHLKLLAEVAALERFREEQRIYYRLTLGTRAAMMLEQVLAQLDQADPVLAADRERLAAVRDQRVHTAGAKWEELRRTAESTYSDPQLAGRILEAVFKHESGASLGELLDVGTGSGSMLRVLGERARHAVGLDMSTQALRVARAKVHGAGLNHCVFRHGDMYELPFGPDSFDTASFDQVLSAADEPAEALREAIRVLRHGGRIIIVEDTARMSGRSTAAPEELLRLWFEQAGAQFGRYSLLQTEQRQLLLGIGQRF